MKLLTEKEAAGMLGLSPGTLKVARSTARGEVATLPFVKLGRAVRYEQDAVISWAEARRVGQARK